MKTSTKAAAGAGVATAALGLTLAFLCPLAGAVAGGWFAYGAAAGAGFGMPAVCALAAAGVVGGSLLGQIAKPIVKFAAVGLGALTAGVVKLFGSVVETAASRNDPAPTPQPAASGGFKASARLSASFQAGGKPPSTGKPSTPGAKPPAFDL
jgi:hypothetical protein